MTDRHATYKRALFPLAKAALERRDYGNIALIESEAHLESLAWTVANYAATDLCLRRRTVLLEMEEVYAALPELRPATIESLPRVTTKVQMPNPALYSNMEAAE